MLDVLANLMPIWHAGHAAGVATVVRIVDSAPRQPGAVIVVAPDGAVAGSVAGGCGEAAVYHLARDVIATGRPTRQRYGISADDAFAVGRSAVLTYGPDGQRQDTGMEVFVAGHAPPPRMLVFGAIDFAAALAQQGALLGYRVTVCDAREVFATRARFPAAEEVVVDWPDRYLTAQAQQGAIDGRTVICVLTHYPKFDVPVLKVALRVPRVGYVGAMGSRRTHDDRLNRLRAEGVTDAELGRLCSPLGLDLGARTPQETAVSIAAEIIAHRWGRGGRPLTETDSRIH